MSNFLETVDAQKWAELRYIRRLHPELFAWELTPEHSPEAYAKKAARNARRAR